MRVQSPLVFVSVLIVALSGCATDFSPNYTLDFAGYPAPVLLNAQSEELLADESRRLSESVSRSATASSMTAFGTSTSTAGGVTTNSSWSVTSTSEYLPPGGGARHAEGNGQRRTRWIVHPGCFRVSDRACTAAVGTLCRLRQHTQRPSVYSHRPLGNGAADHH